MSATSDAYGSSIPALLADSAQRFAEHVAIVDDARTLSYPQLLESSHEFAAALIASGIRRGDRVAIWSFNCAEWIVALFGILEAGAELVPINTRFKGVEAADILARSQARALVTVTDFLGTDYVEMLRSSGVDLPLLDTVVAHGPTSAGAVAWVDFMGRATDASRREAGIRAAALGPDDTSDILFTS